MVTSSWLAGQTPGAATNWTRASRTLQDQALPAFINHAQVQKTPSQATLDDLAAFQLTLVQQSRRAGARQRRQRTAPHRCPTPILRSPRSNSRVRRSSMRACAQCHGGPGQSTTSPLLVARFARHRYHLSAPRGHRLAAAVRIRAVPRRVSPNKVRTYEFTLANGTKIRRASSDPGRALLTGFVGGPPPLDDWNKLDVPGLHGIGQTAPYFHNNSAATLEDVVDHYIEFFKFVQATCAARCGSAGRVDGRHPLRPDPKTRRAGGADRIPAEALAGPRGRRSISDEHLTAR